MENLISDFYNWKKIRFCIKFSKFLIKITTCRSHFFVKINVAQNFLRCSSSDINLSYFGKFRFPIFPIGKKSDFVSNFRNFRSKSPFVGVTFFVKIQFVGGTFFFKITIWRRFKIPICKREPDLVLHVLWLVLHVLWLVLHVLCGRRVHSN